MDNKRISLLVLFSLLFVVGFLGLASAAPTITQTGLQSSYLKTNLVSTSGTSAQINANVQNAIVGATPIQVTLSSDTAYSSVRIAPVNAGSHIQLWAKDTSNNWYDINAVGWGPITGFPISSGYSATTPVYVISDQSGVYNLNINLIDLTNSSSVITFSSVNLGIVSTSQSDINLGTASSFAILAKSGISTIGNTLITGNIGVGPAAATFITGFGLTMDSSNQFSTSSLVNGKVYAVDYTPPTPTIMTTAISDMQTAYVAAAGLTLPTATELGAGNIAGMTLTPGLYKWSSAVNIPTSVTLDCLGNTSAVFVFQVAQTLTLGNGASINLNGGCQASNIFWQVGSQTTLGTTSVFNGNILDLTNIVLNTGAILNGRAMAQTAVTLQANTITSTNIATVTNVYTNPTYPNPFHPNLTTGLNTTYIYATFSSNVNSADLIYQISGDPTIHTTNFSGPFSGGYAGITIGHPINGEQVTYQIETFDSSGNILEATLPASFYYDGSAPITTDNASSSWTNQNVTIKLTCTDFISGCNRTYYSTDGSYPTIPYISPFTLSQTGQYQLKYYSIDNAGNVESSETGTLVQIDKSLPVVSISYPANIVYNHSITQLNYIRSDYNSGLASCWYSVNGGVTNSSPDSACSNFTPNSVEGINNWIVYVQDNAGNINSASIQFVQDTIPPAISYNPTTLLGNSYTNNNWILVNVSASDLHLSNVVLNWNGINTTFATNAGSNYWTNETGLSDGNYAFYVWANDSVGNSNIISTRTVVIDTMAPQVSFTTGTPINDSNLSQNYIFVNTTASDLNLKNITTYLYNSNFALINEDGKSANFSGLPNGIYYINSTAYDLAGNSKSTETRMLILDTIVPTLSITSNTTTDNMDYFTVESNSADVGGTGVNQVNLVLTNSTGIVVASGIMSNVPSTTKYDYLLPMWNLSVGTYTLSVNSTDYAGNMNSITHSFIVQDNLAPTQITTINGVVNTSTGGNVSFVFNLISRNSTGQIRFGMDNIAGLTPFTLNATISNGTANVAVGNSAFSGSQLLTMSNLQTIAPGVVSGTFTLYLTLPANMTVGTYPVNYYINNV